MTVIPKGKTEDRCPFVTKASGKRARSSCSTFLKSAFMSCFLYIVYRKCSLSFLFHLRLVFRRHYCLAIRICDYLKVPKGEGASRILGHWACYKVRKKASIHPDILSVQTGSFTDDMYLLYMHLLRMTFFSSHRCVCVCVF